MNPSRWSILTTTPHSRQNKDSTTCWAARFPALPSLSLDCPEGRAELHSNYVQRRRGDIRKYLANTTY